MSKDMKKRIKTILDEYTSRLMAVMVEAVSGALGTVAPKASRATKGAKGRKAAPKAAKKPKAPRAAKGAKAAAKPVVDPKNAPVSALHGRDLADRVVQVIKMQTAPITTRTIADRLGIDVVPVRGAMKFLMADKAVVKHGSRRDAAYTFAG
jgi:hypothetical protein